MSERARLAAAADAVDAALDGRRGELLELVGELVSIDSQIPPSPTSARSSPSSNCSHMAFHEDPDAYRRTVDEFLRSV